MLVDEHETEHLRTIIYDRFEREWKVVHRQEVVGHLIWLLGYSNITAMLREYTDEDARVVKLLAGEHGYTIYKAMVARKNAA